MRIISKRRLREFWEKNEASETPLIEWYKLVRKAEWKSFADVRDSFRHADVYRDCVIFDIGGNKFRLITKIRYRKSRIYVRFVLSHKEYDNNVWRKDCEC